MMSRYLKCMCSDNSMLSACFANQLWEVRNAFCPDQCCSALMMGHCIPVCRRIIQRCLAVTLQCCQPEIGSLHTSMMSRYFKCTCSDNSMLSACFAEQHRAVRNAFCPDQCCSALVMGHCTPVSRRNKQRCLCSDTTMLSACFAEQHRAVRNAFCPDQCCSALKLGHCTPV